MKQPGKVLWFEGLNLSPHQFQRQDQYHEARLHSISSALSPRLWGVRLLEWDLDGLRDNVLRTTSMSLVFQDGEIYDAPDTDALPAPFDLGSLASDEETFTFHIALPLLKDHGGNFSGGDGFLASARYAQQERYTDGYETGARPPSLSDEEAVALWDKLTGSIRGRPTSP